MLLFIYVDEIYNYSLHYKNPQPLYKKNIDNKYNHYTTYTSQPTHNFDEDNKKPNYKKQFRRFHHSQTTKFSSHQTQLIRIRFAFLSPLSLTLLSQFSQDVASVQAKPHTDKTGQPAAGTSNELKVKRYLANASSMKILPPTTFPLKKKWFPNFSSIWTLCYFF